LGVRPTRGCVLSLGAAIISVCFFCATTVIGKPAEEGRLSQALSDLIDRKPHLLRFLAAQVLPPPFAAIDPAQHLGFDLTSLRTVEDFRQVLSTVLAAVARGEIAPSEAARIARRVCARLRAARRLARLAPVRA
jgi:hypothetical protein